MILLTGCGGAEEPGDDEEIDDATAAEALSRGSNAKTAFRFFVAKGLSDVQAAGIVGNLQQESSVDPRAVQPGGPGRGIAQWSVGARWNASRGDNLASFASQHGGSPWSLDTQLAFIWFELQSFPTYGLGELKRARTVDAAVHAFQREFEVCGNCKSTRRIQFAKAALASYGGGR